MFESVFQSFDEAVAERAGPERLAALRALFDQRGIEGFLVPRADEHQNEYVPKCAERLAWLTGFSGSAGLAIILKSQAALFIDGRYALQARGEVDEASFEVLNIGQTSPERWLEDNARPAWRIAYDPWLHTPAQVARYEKAVKAAGGSLVSVRVNPVDAIWTDRPRPPEGEIWLHPTRFAGEDAAAKIARVKQAMARADALVISDPHAVAWLFNIRGSDLAHTPVALAFAIVPAEGAPTLFIESRKVPASAREALEQVAMIEPPTALVETLEKFGRERRFVRFDSATAPMRLAQAVENAGGFPDSGADPVALMKARKNAVELAGARAAHLRDGAAVVNFLAWFEKSMKQRGKVTEIDVVKALESFRRDTGLLKDVSFPTISGAGPHAAIVHYRVTEKTSRSIGPGLFLLDSGAQYEDGTTDITRTIAVGKPAPDMRDRYTRVLKGHIAIATSVFPKGTAGSQLDSFARKSLWDVGLDFDHGTGHGVGSYLSVHEGPQRISKLGATPLDPGMILSNEPGYYKEKRWGVRIENLVVVEPRKIKDGEREMLGFATLTLAPIDTRAIDLKLMTKAEVDWLNAYHARVYKELAPLLDAPVARWLAGATKALKTK